MIIMRGFEEEHWIEYIKKEKYTNPMVDQNSQKNEMEIGDENRIATGRKMGSENSCMEP